MRDWTATEAPDYGHVQQLAMFAGDVDPCGSGELFEVGPGGEVNGDDRNDVDNEEATKHAH